MTFTNLSSRQNGKARQISCPERMRCKTCIPPFLLTRKTTHSSCGRRPKSANCSTSCKVAANNRLRFGGDFECKNAIGKGRVIFRYQDGSAGGVLYLWCRDCSSRSRIQRPP